MLRRSGPQEEGPREAPRQALRKLPHLFLVGDCGNFVTVKFTATPEFQRYGTFRKKLWKPSFCTIHLCTSSWKKL
jgi:hypothetical protein